MLQQLSQLNLSKKKLLIREDLNVPLQAGKISSNARITAALPTLRLALQAQAAVIVLSHLGRPKEQAIAEQPQFSLAPVAAELQRLLPEYPVRLVASIDAARSVQAGELVLLENIRSFKGEAKNSPELARELASLADIVVMDAFATAHRAQASTEGVLRQAAVACAGPLLAAEVEALQRATHQPSAPVVAIVGGAKVSTKLEVVAALARIADHVIVGGGIANTFLAAAGHPVGKSLCEIDMLDEARSIMAQVNIPLPLDVVIAPKFSADAPAQTLSIDQVGANDMILDIGAATSKNYAELIATAGTIIWNGPVGVFEFARFAEGTRQLGAAIAASPAYSLAGGGDTVAAIEQFGLAKRISYISTAGGAFLEFIAGKRLPALQALGWYEHQ